MSNTIKASVFDVKETPNLFLNNFEDILKELSSKLDDTDSSNTRILDINQYQNETSIWFDSFDDVTNFDKDNKFDDTICFLLAKDITYQFVENTKKKIIENSSNKKNIKPKTPSHCVFIKSENILLMEETTDTPTIATLKRGILNHLKMKQDDLLFNPKYHEDVIERLEKFVDNIQSIEISDLNIQKYLKEEGDTTGYIGSILSNPETKLTTRLELHSNDLRSKTVNFFKSIFDNRITKELSNIKIIYKDEKEKNEIIMLYNNLIYIKIEKDIYHEDITELKNNDRLDYSKSIYKTLIEAYHE